MHFRAIWNKLLFVTLLFSGGPLGSVISLPITGFISSSIGWPIVFYLYGGLGAAWSVIWIFLGSDSPSKHPNISDEERKYIEEGLQNDDNKEVIYSNLLYFQIDTWQKIT